MDAKPFLEVNMLSLDDIEIDELAKFSKAAFNVDAILATASELKYMKEIKRVLANEVQQPSEDLVRLFLSRVYEGRATEKIRAQFSELVRRALQEFISDRVRDRLKSALAGETAQVTAPATSAVPEVQVDENGEKLETTADEKDAWLIVKAILAEIVDPRRIAIRDQKSYCAILFDDNNRRPVCRLHFNSKARRYVGLFDESRTESRVPLDDLSDLFKYGGQIKATVQRYLKGKDAEADVTASAPAPS
jgi:hypothetical protein